MRASIDCWFQDESPAPETIQAAFYDFEGSLKPEPQVQSACRNLLQSLAVELAELGEAEVPRAFQGDCLKAYNILQSGEAFQIHESWLDPFEDDYDPQVLNRLRQGGRWNSAEQEWALDIQSGIQTWFQCAFDNYDCVILPTVPFPALEFSKSSETKRQHMMSFTTPASICGLSALIIPVKLASGFTAGIQVLTPEPAPRLWAALLKALE